MKVKLSSKWLLKNARSYLQRSVKMASWGSVRDRGKIPKMDAYNEFNSFGEDMDGAVAPWFVNGDDENGGLEVVLMLLRILWVN